MKVTMAPPNAAPHLPPPGRRVERKHDTQTLHDLRNGKRGRRLGGGAKFGFLIVAPRLFPQGFRLESEQFLRVGHDVKSCNDLKGSSVKSNRCTTDYPVTNA